ncbi:MAG: AAA family ATPase [Anaerolineae bacterium]|jgi:CO dehydrogenase maturation factor|nr:AAA family ATPase [Anaerolineae bacterium]
MPKIAITGKGGVGKTTLTALLSYIYTQRGQDVIAIDADPAGNLGLAFGLPANLDARLQPIAEMEDLIYERTGAQKGTIGGVFRLNPKVDDIPESFSVRHRGVRLLRLGTVRGGGAGCICPESALLKALVTHMLLRRNQTLILDMEAGVEHLGRGTAGAVDAFIIVVEPGLRSLGTAEQIHALAAEIGIKQFYLVANKSRGPQDDEFVRQHAAGLPFLGSLPFSSAAVTADQAGVAVFDEASELVAAAARIADHLAA